VTAVTRPATARPPSGPSRAPVAVLAGPDLEEHDGDREDGGDAHQRDGDRVGGDAVAAGGEHDEADDEQHDRRDEPAQGDRAPPVRRGHQNDGV